MFLIDPSIFSIIFKIFLMEYIMEKNNNLYDIHIQMQNANQYHSTC
jgi:hypothetical protein